MIFPMKYDRFGYIYLESVKFYITHSGIDLNYGNPGEDYGLPVKSITNGYICYINKRMGWGNLIVIKHPRYDVYSRYGHLKCFVSGLKLGSRVKEGQKIGECGNTGNSSGSHLHFDIIKRRIRFTSYTRFKSIGWVKNTYENPIKWIKQKIEEQRKEKKKYVPSEWAKEAWLQAKKIGLIKTSKPRDNITTEQLIVILDRLNLLT